MRPTVHTERKLMNSGGHDTAGMSVTEMSQADKCQSRSEAHTDSAQAKNAFCQAALSSASKQESVLTETIFRSYRVSPG